MDNGTDTDYYDPHTDFDLTSLTMKREEIFLQGGTVPFIELTIEVELTRRYRFFYYMYILPANVLLFAMPLVHYVPSNSLAKFIVCKLLYSVHVFQLVSYCTYMYISL